MIDEKEELRRSFLRMRKALSKESVENKSFHIIKKLKKMIDSKTKTILFYVPINNEVDLIPFARDLLADGMNVLFPKLIKKENIKPYIVKDLFNDFIKGTFNIPEPNTEAFDGNIDIAFIPGIVFDKNGYRIGYGKGYFDRFLNSGKVINSIGICYGFQLLKNIPHTEYDYRLDGIVSENDSVLINKK